MSAPNVAIEDAAPTPADAKLAPGIKPAIADPKSAANAPNLTLSVVDNFKSLSSI